MEKNKFKQTEIGAIPEGWEESSVGNNIELVYGDGLITRERKGGDISVYGSNGIIGQHNEALVKGPGIIIGRKGTVGQVTFSKTDFWPIDTTYYVKTKGENDILFWYYFLKTLNLTEMNSHSAVPGLNRDYVYEIKKHIPSFNEQRAIAKILSDLDEKIELNNQMNKTLESIAQAIFKEWFIAFRFPDYEKTKFKNGLPDGWGKKEIKDCGDIICGKTPATINRDNYGADIPFITIPDMRNFVFVIKTEKILSKQGADLQKNKYLSALSVCVSCIATPGLVSLTSEVSQTNQQINSIICKKEISPYFMYFSMLNKSEEIKTMGLGGTATLNLNTGNFARISIVVPNDFIMKKFHKVIEPIMQQILENLRENKKLNDICDSLLPKLMSGKIRIKRSANA
ncbi:MAG: restriction endonuclease subunit S [Elusimicrobia bacterium]|nr:restriction endonuclease subunit S [Elusimicrobiota bacterium]